MVNTTDPYNLYNDKSLSRSENNELIWLNYSKAASTREIFSSLNKLKSIFAISEINLFEVAKSNQK